MLFQLKATENSSLTGKLRMDTPDMWGIHPTRLRRFEQSYKLSGEWGLFGNVRSDGAGYLKYGALFRQEIGVHQQFVISRLVDSRQLQVIFLMLGVVDKIGLRARQSERRLAHTGEIRATRVVRIQQDAVAEVVGRKQRYTRGFVRQNLEAHRNGCAPGELCCFTPLEGGQPGVTVGSVDYPGIRDNEIVEVQGLPADAGVHAHRLSCRLIVIRDIENELVIHVVGRIAGIVVQTRIIHLIDGRGHKSRIVPGDVLDDRTLVGSRGRGVADAIEDAVPVGIGNTLRHDHVAIWKRLDREETYEPAVEIRRLRAPILTDAVRLP